MPESSSIKQQLTLIQLSDSFFPSGGYTLSHGLESLIQQNQIHNQEGISSFLQILIQQKIAPCDLVALIHGFHASTDNDIEQIQQIAAQLYAQTLIETTRDTQRQSGRALLMVAQSTWQHSQLEILARQQRLNQFHCLHPVVFGVVGNIAGLTVRNTAIAFLHGFITGVLGAAIRLGHLGHLQAQQLLGVLATDIERAYNTASSMSLADMWSCAPTIDLAQIHHRQLNSKLFAS